MVARVMKYISYDGPKETPVFHVISDNGKTEIFYNKLEAFARANEISPNFWKYNEH